MGKRKTREQKKIAELRHKLSNQTVSSKQEPVKENNTKKFFYKLPNNIKYHGVSTPYLYLQDDLYKTSLLSLFIIAIQLCLLFLLQAHILTIPAMHY